MRKARGPKVQITSTASTPILREKTPIPSFEIFFEVFDVTCFSTG